MGIVWEGVFFFLSCFFLKRVLLSVEVSSLAFFPEGGGVGIGTVEISCTRIWILAFLGIWGESMVMVSVSCSV